MDFRKYAVDATGGDVHIDTPLSNVAVAAFAGADDFIAGQLFPTVPVAKQSDKYYVIDRASWLTVPNTLRAPKTAPRRVQWKVSSDAFYCHNYALSGENALEDLVNADMALRLRENTATFVAQALARDYEVRVANMVTSLTNLGSGTTLSGGNKWSDFVNSDPISDITTGHAFIRQITGLTANVAVIDQDTMAVVRRHPALLELYKYTQGGQLNDEQLAACFGVQKILVGKGVKNTALEGATASMSNIWGNNLILCRVQPGASVQTQTFGLSFQWSPPELGIPFASRVYNDPDPGKKVEVVEIGYYQTEKIVASELSYGIAATL